MKIVDREDLKPKCPHCADRLSEVFRISDDKSFFQGHLGYCYVCPSCEKIIGFSDFKGG